MRHLLVERHGLAREVADLLVVATVARDEHRYDDDRGDLLRLEPADRVLEARGPGGGPHEERDLDRAAGPRRGGGVEDVGVPEGVAAVRDDERPDAHFTTRRARSPRRDLRAGARRSGYGGDWRRDDDRGDGYDVAV
jgi:hypothetical protein